MRKIKVKINRDEDGIPSTVVISRGRKKLKIGYNPDSGFEIEGKADLLPSFAEIARMIFPTQPDTIVTIRESGEEDRVYSFENLTPKTVFVNPNFEHGLAGWKSIGDIIIDVNKTYYESPSVQFDPHHAVEQSLYQSFPIPLGVDWFSSIEIVGESTLAGNELQVQYIYSDGTFSNHALNFLLADTMVQIALSPTAGKNIQTIRFYKVAGQSATVYLNRIVTVF